jgi:hypothetical protein
LAAAAIALSATVLYAALPPTSDTSGRTSLAGQLLIATPALRGSPFERSVILIAQHNKDGALGVVINHPLNERPIASLIEASGADATSINGSVRVFRGGPVSREIAFVLHSADYHLADTLDIDGRVALTASKCCATWAAARARPKAWLPSAMPAGVRHSSTTRSPAAIGTPCPRIRRWCSMTIAPKSGPMRWRGIRRIVRA